MYKSEEHNAKIYNGTPHAINIIEGCSLDTSDRKYKGGNCILEIPSNGMLNANIETKEASNYFIGSWQSPVISCNCDGACGNACPDQQLNECYPWGIEVGIPIFKKEITGCDPLPKGYDIYIVSVLYATAYVAKFKNSNKLYTITNPVMSDDGKTFIGCRGICKF